MTLQRSSSYCANPKLRIPWRGLAGRRRSLPSRKSLALRPCEFTPLQLASRYGHLEVKYNEHRGCHVKGSVRGILLASARAGGSSTSCRGRRQTSTRNLVLQTSCCKCVSGTCVLSQVKGCSSSSLCLPGLAESTPLLEAIDHQHLHVAGLMFRLPCGDSASYYLFSTGVTRSDCSDRPCRKTTDKQRTRCEVSKLEESVWSQEV